jgi:thymidylate synthase (FAD)
VSVKLVTITPDAEKLIVHCARVSNPANQDNPEYARLVKYLLEHSHFSPFELAHAVLEINTSRAIAAQILRHRSFSFQEFSQRYQAVSERPQAVPGRKQAEKNRQSSAAGLDGVSADVWQECQEDVYNNCFAQYERALKFGVAREQARMLLPLATPTRMYMAGTVRSWIHYVQLRCQTDTQLEHRVIAEQCREILAAELPTVAEALGWP